MGEGAGDKVKSRVEGQRGESEGAGESEGQGGRLQAEGVKSVKGKVKDRVKG